MAATTVTFRSIPNGTFRPSSRIRISIQGILPSDLIRIKAALLSRGLRASIRPQVTNQLWICDFALTGRNGLTESQRNDLIEDIKSYLTQNRRYYFGNPNHDLTFAGQ